MLQRKFLILSLILIGHSAFSQEKIYKNLVFEGGGLKGIAYGGALAELENRGVLAQIQRVAGTSAGAIQACLLAVGYTAEEISHIINETPFESFNDGGGPFRGTPRLVKHFGWYAGNSFLKTMQYHIKARTGKADITFAELHELAKNAPYRDLYVTGVNLSKQQLEVFSYETYPNMSISDAVRVSMSIPVYYRAVFLNDKGKVVNNAKSTEPYNVFVDGGLLKNYPIDIFDNTKYLSDTTLNQREEYIQNMETVGIKLEKCEQIDVETQQIRQRVPYDIKEFSTYMSALYSVVMHNMNPTKPDDTKRTIYINDGTMNSRIRKIANDEKQLMMLCGKQGVIEFFLNSN